MKCQLRSIQQVYSFPNTYDLLNSWFIHFSYTLYSTILHVTHFFQFFAYSFPLNSTYHKYNLINGRTSLIYVLQHFFNALSLISEHRNTSGSGAYILERAQAPSKLHYVRGREGEADSLVLTKYFDMYNLYQIDNFL